MPTINKGSDYFGVLTYTGDGAASKTVVDTNAVSFTPDFVWIKGRSGATDHALYDVVRGTTKDLVSNSTAAETTQSTGLTAFTNGGFTIGNLAKLNTSGATYVAWCWKANGAGVSNTSGSITSTVSVNTTAGFSVVTYTGNGSANQTIGHGLGVSPKMAIIKGRSNVFGWGVQHIGLTGGNNYLALNTTAAQATDNTQGSISNANSTTLQISGSGGASSWSNANAATYVAYCWAEIAGFSKFGSYTGNGSADGPFVYTGFRPAYVLLKSATQGAGYDWEIYDNKRLGYNLTNSILYPDLSNAEATTAGIDILSNGFKLRVAGGNNNASGHTIIFAAFAEHPFKNSNSR